MKIHHQYHILKNLEIKKSHWTKITKKSSLYITAYRTISMRHLKTYIVTRPIGIITASKTRGFRLFVAFI